jgi:hypothetical protein
MNFDYKKYSLENLENWIHDAISCSEASPQEIYDVIKGVVDENYYIHKLHASRCYELLALLNGNGKGHIQAYDDYLKSENKLECDKDDPSPECKNAWADFWEDEPYSLHVSEDGDIYPVKDKVVKWQLPVEVDGSSGEYFVTFPDDLLGAVNLKEGDQVEWVEQGDGSYLLRKV